MIYLKLPYPFFNYNPYSESYLAAAIRTNDTLRQPMFEYNPYDNSSGGKDMIFLSDIDMYDQPVINPIFALTIVSPVQIAFMISSIFIQVRTLQMLNRETSVNNLLMATQAKIHIIFWPSFTIATALTETLYPLVTHFTPIFCYILKFYVYFCFFSFILYSFYAALLRYLFLLHTAWSTKFGKERLIKLIYWVFYLHTLLWSSYTCSSFGDLDHLPLINSCFGIHHNVFLAEATSVNMLRRHFCISNTDKGIFAIIHIHTYP